jgi:hypothetical protein
MVVLWKVRVRVTFFRLLLGFVGSVSLEEFGQVLHAPSHLVYLSLSTIRSHLQLFISLHTRRTQACFAKCDAQLCLCGTDKRVGCRQRLLQMLQRNHGKTLRTKRSGSSQYSLSGSSFHLSFQPSSRRAYPTGL